MNRPLEISNPEKLAGEEGFEPSLNTGRLGVDKVEYKLIQDIHTTVPDEDNPGKCYFFPKGTVVEGEFVGSIEFEDDELGLCEIPLELLEGFVLPLNLLEPIREEK